jgi:hypothetical protein
LPKVGVVTAPYYKHQSIINASTAIAVAQKTDVNLLLLYLVATTPAKAVKELVIRMLLTPML